MIGFTRASRYGFSLLFALLLVTGGNMRANAASSSGLDTPTSVGTLPFSIQGTEVMTLSASGLTIDQGSIIASNPGAWWSGCFGSSGCGLGGSGQYGVYGYGTSIGVYGSSPGGYAGYFAGNVQTTGALNVGGAIIAGGSVTAGNGGPGYFYLYGSSIYDNGNYLHLGSSLVTTDGSLTVSGNLQVNGSAHVNTTMQAQRYYDDNSNYYIDSNTDSYVENLRANYVCLGNGGGSSGGGGDCRNAWPGHNYILVAATYGMSSGPPPSCPGGWNLASWVPVPGYMQWTIISLCQQ